MYYVLSQNKICLVKISLGHIGVCNADEHYKIFDKNEEVECDNKYFIVFIDAKNNKSLLGAYETEERRNSVLNQLITMMNRVPHGVFAMPEK